MKFQLEDAVAVLGRTPGALQALLADLPDGWVRVTEGPDTWSPFDVVGHLIDGEETDWIPRARVIMAGGAHPAFERFDRFRHLRVNLGTPMGDLLARFGRLRAKSLMSLEELRLTPTDLELTGIHPEFGRVTMRQLLATWVAHDLGHVGQIARVMAKGYADAVGPWRKYLPVLAR